MSEAQMLHQWSYVVIPVSSPINSAERMFPLFVAHCRVCKAYFSEFVPVVAAKGTLSGSSIPKYGCQMPPDGIIA